MWFKNLIVYQFTKPFNLNSQELQEKLKQYSFQKCAKQSMESIGWIAPLGKDFELLTYQVQNFLMFCFHKEEKILPNSVVNEYLQERVEKIENEQNRQVYNREKKTLKDDIVFDLINRAFTKKSSIFAYIDLVDGWLVVDSPSYKKAEEMTSLLRKTLGNLSISNIEVDINVLMTHWLKKPNEMPYEFTLGYDCEIKEKQELGGKINIKNQDLHSEELKAYLNSNMEVSKLALNWKGHQSFMLNDNFIIQKVKCSDVFEEQLDSSNFESCVEKFDTSFSLMASINQEMLSDLVNKLGKK